MASPSAKTTLQSTKKARESVSANDTGANVTPAIGATNAQNSVPTILLKRAPKSARKVKRSLPTVSRALETIVISDTEDERGGGEANVVDHEQPTHHHIGQETNGPAEEIDQAVNAFAALHLTGGNDGNEAQAADINLIQGPLSADRVYAVDSRLLRGTSIEWSEAGAVTQGVRARGRVRRLTPLNKPTYHWDFYLVLRGHSIGTFSSKAEVDDAVAGFYGSVWQGFTDPAHAEDLHRFAKRRGWVVSSEGREYAYRYEFVEPTPVPDNWYPGLDISYMLELNWILEEAYRSVPEARKWYVVTIGVRPGIYMTYIEAAINTIGVKGAVHRAHGSLLEARIYMQSTIRKNNVIARPRRRALF